MKPSSIASMAVAVIATLGAASCQPDHGNLTTQNANTLPAPAVSADGCSGVSPLLPRVVCKDENLSAQNAALATAMREQLKILSDEGRQILLNDEIGWFEAERAECAVTMTETTLSQDARLCLSVGLLGRLMAVTVLTDWNGPYLMQRVDKVFTTRLQKPQNGDGPATHAPGVFMSAISYPRIDSAVPGAAAFNAAAVRAPRFMAKEQTEEITIYKIAYAGPDIVSAQFVSYAIPMGGLEKTRQVNALSFLMKEGRPIEQRDVFKVGTKWLDFVTDRANTRIAGDHDVCDTPRSQTEFRSALGRAANWVISDSGLIILSIEPNTLDGCSVMISWEDLAPYLKEHPPAPIGAQKKAVRLLAEG